MTHDPLCPLDSECPGRDRPHFVVEGDTWCGGCQVECQCALIAKARADERWATVESAVYVASQHGAVPELVQLLSRLYEAPEVHMDEEVRREAVHELTRDAQKMGLIP